MEIVQEMIDLLARMSALVHTVSEYRNWRKCYLKSLSQCREYASVMKRDMLPGTKARLISLICRMKILNVHLHKHVSRVGGNIYDRKKNNASTLVWEEMETAFRDRVLTGIVINVAHIEPVQFLQDAKRLVTRHISELLNTHSTLKVNVVFEGEFVLKDKVSLKSFGTRNSILFTSANLRNWYRDDVVKPILASLQEFQERDSGWALKRISNLLVNCNKYVPFQFGCTLPLPEAVLSKKAVVNIDSNENDCFYRAIVACLYKPTSQSSRVSSYPHYKDVFNRTERFQTPVSFKHINKFELKNNVSINIFEWKGKKIESIRLTKNKQRRHVNLLFVQDKQNPSSNHFAAITNLSRLVSWQLPNKNRKKFICDRCLQYFFTVENLNAHIVECIRMNECALMLPTDKDKWLRFVNYTNKEWVPFVVYADLECLLTETEGRHRGASLYQSHRPFAVGYYIHCRYDESLCGYQCYRSDTGSVEWFARELHLLSDSLERTLNVIIPMNQLTVEETKQFRTATRCHICERLFNVSDTKVRDHCHLTGRYRGPAHATCNLKYNESYVVPVVFHNLSGYDAHFIIRELANTFEGKIDLLPLTKERYISFTKHTKRTSSCKRYVKFRFIDSFKFLNSSLDKLASYLDKDSLRIVKNGFTGFSDSDLALITRKGVFPYDYVSSYDKLNDTSLPPREAFYNKLIDRNISDADYNHAKNVWSRFHIGTLGEYSDLYLKTDVLLLADIFENFRTNCMSSYKLDPAHYYTLPGFAWDVMLKYTNIELELLTDVDMLMFVERGIRGGLSQCSHRHVRANNKYLSTYDSSEPSTYLMYFDVNNLYGWAMSQSLPYRGFRWIDSNTRDFDVNTIPIDGSVGYILEVDLEYPREIHDVHMDLPFCPNHDNTRDKQRKLLATLYDKKKYVIHYRYLQQCMRHGLKLKKIHRILKFEQCEWLRKYVDLNTKLRADSNNDYSKNLFKLMNNAVYGKTMENVRKHKDIKLISRWDGRYGAERLISRPNFHSCEIFSEDLVVIQMNRVNIKFYKPIYIGMSILDISKIRLYEFHYDYMYPNFKENCKILYTDTDSLIYKIVCDDIYEAMKREIHRYDTCNYDQNNLYGIPLVNNKVLGLMKDENAGRIMVEFVGLRAKMYATRVCKQDKTNPNSKYNNSDDVDYETNKKIKGIMTNVVTKAISFNDYIDCLYNHTLKSVSNNRITSICHNVYSTTQSKLALSSHDDKRYVCANLINTLPWGHYTIENN